MILFPNMPLAKQMNPPKGNIYLVYWASNVKFNETTVLSRELLCDDPLQGCIFGTICIIPDAVSERNNASTCICEITLAAQSKIASFQNLLLASNEEIGAL